MDSFILKIDWANEHLKQLDSHLKRWIDSVPYGIVDEPDPQPLRGQLSYAGEHRRFRVTHVSPVPDVIGLLVGDCVHNLRSALDHLTLALGQAHIRRAQNRNMTEREIQGSEFPIFFDRAMKPDEETKKIGCLDPAARAIIQGLQPHLRGRAYRNDPLWQIHELDRIDKHRRLTMYATLATGRDPAGHVGFKRTEDWTRIFDLKGERTGR